MPLGTAVGPLGAARIKTRVRTLLYVFQRVWGEAPPRRRTNAGCLKKKKDTQPAHLRSRIFNSEILYELALTFSTLIFSEKSKKLVGNDLQVTICPGKKT